MSKETSGFHTEGKTIAGIPQLPSCVYIMGLLTAIYSKSHGRMMSFSLPPLDPMIPFYPVILLTILKCGDHGSAAKN